jgi:V8-like Glu-specific endopeptidase
LPDKIEIEACGYPGDKIVSTVKQYGAKGKITKIYNGVIYHDIDTMKGQSGSPILAEYIEGYYFALGVHVKFHNKEDINCASQLTKENNEEIKQMIQDLVGESASFKIVKLNGLRLPQMSYIQLQEE